MFIIKGAEDEEMHRPQLPALPESLEGIQRAEHFPTCRHRWNTNEEIASILISFDKHESWLSKEVKIRPKSGSMMLYSRKRVRYRRDGYCWKKRKDGKTTREDHMKLKVQGTECIYGCYVHSAILFTFHRRCYWLLQNPDIVLVHYLNVPYTDDNKIISPKLNYFADSKKEWTKDELINELKPMLFSETTEPDLNNELELSSFETLSSMPTIEGIVQQLMAKQRERVKTLEDALTVVSVTKDGGGGGKAGASLAQKNPNKNNLVKREQLMPATGTTCIITAPTSQGSTVLPRVSGQGVQLLQLASSGSGTGAAQLRPATSVAGTAGGQMISFNLSQLSHLQNGNGILIINSASQANTTNTVTGASDGSPTVGQPVTLLYSRSNSTATGTVQVKSLSTHMQEFAAGSSTATVNKLPNATVLIKNEPNPATTTTRPSNLNVGSRFAGSNDPGAVTAMDVANGNFTLLAGIKCEPSDLDEASSQRSLRSSFSNSPSATRQSETTNEESEEGENMILDCSPPFSQDNVIAPLSLDQLKVEPMQQISDNINQTMSSAGSQRPSALVSGNAASAAQPHHQHNSFEHQLVDMVTGDNPSDDLNPMDFIDNDISAPYGDHEELELFSLEAFDMLPLHEFPNLDDLNSLNSSSPFRQHSRGLTGNNNGVGQHPQNQLKSSELLNNGNAQQLAVADRAGDSSLTIADYSPEWSYTEGGMKVLVAGPWQQSNSTQYSVLFDGISVPTSLVQSGVLRAFSPAHEPGYVTMQVQALYQNKGDLQGCVVSNSVIFEYREHPTSPSVQSSE